MLQKLGGPTAPNVRPISGASVLERACGTARWRLMSKWQGAWSHEEQFRCFHSGRALMDASALAALDASMAQPLVLCMEPWTWTWPRPVNRIPREIAYWLMPPTGIDGLMLQALQGWRLKASFRYKIHLGMG